MDSNSELLFGLLKSFPEFPYSFAESKFKQFSYDMNVLIIDDEANIRRTTSLALKTIGHRAYTADDSSGAEAILCEEPVDVIFLDLMLRRENGMDYLKKLKARNDDTPVVIFTANSTIELAVKAIKEGAYDFIEKPFTPDEIRRVLGKLKKSLLLEAKIKDLEKQVEVAHPTISLESEETEMNRVFEIALRAAVSEASILLLGPSGTGKTVLARAIHESSARSDKRFVTVNCPSLSKELLEGELFGHVKGAFTGAQKDTWGKVAAAEGGTLFLDEIGELPTELQPKLLRLLQDFEYERVGETRTRKADIRLIAATNRNLEDEVKEGSFREDLYYRLNVISVEMLPLAKRPADLEKLAHRYLEFFSKQQGRKNLKFSRETLASFADYEWPGNLRELRNVIERAVILSMGDEITLVDLPNDFQKPVGGGVSFPGAMTTLEELEESHIKRVISKTESLDEAAQVLGIDPATLYRKRKKMGLTQGDA